MQAALACASRPPPPRPWRRRARAAAGGAVAVCALGGDRGPGRRLTGPERAARLRTLLQGEEALVGPAVYDGLSARLTEAAGFDMAFLSGFSVAAAAGFPDAGLLSYGEVLRAVASTFEATTALPIIADGDTGYGNCVSVKRTVAGFAAAGAAGILIEDQTAPKSCGHVRGKAVVPRADAVARVRAAVDARDEGGSGIFVVARSDARQAESLAEALWRAAAFADAGADAVFIDALTSVDEMRALVRAVPPRVVKMANNLEGGGKTPVLPPAELAALGFKLVAYPLSLVGAAVAAQRDALAFIRQGVEPPGLPSFTDLQTVVGFPEYWAEADRYKGEGGGGEPASPPPPPPPRQSRPPPAFVPRADDDDRAPSPSPAPAATTATVEPDAIVLARGADRADADGAAAAYPSSALTRVDFLRIKISNDATGTVKLETRIPAGFVQGLSLIVPQAAGLDLDAIARLIAGDPGWTRDEPVWEGEAGAGDRVQIFVE